MTLAAHVGPARAAAARAAAAPRAGVSSIVASGYMPSISAIADSRVRGMSVERT